MKNFLKAFLALTLCISLTISVPCIGIAAEDDIEANLKFDAVSNKLEVSGSVKSEKGNVPLVLTVTTSENVLTGYAEAVSGNSVNGRCAFEFEGIPFSAYANSDTYTVSISAEFVGFVKNISYDYKGIDSKYEALSALEEVSELEGEAAVTKMKQAVKQYYEILGLANQPTDAETTIIVDMLMTVNYNCPDDYASDDNKEKVLAEIVKAAKIVSEAEAIIKVCNFKTAADVEAWLDKYAEEYGFYEDNPKTAYDDEKSGKYFDEATLSTELISDMAKASKSARSVDEVIKIMHSKAILKIIAKSNNYKVKEIAEAIPKMFGINVTALSKLDDSNKTKLYRSVSGKEYEEVSDFGKAINEKVKDLSKEEHEKGDLYSPSRPSVSTLGGTVQSGADASNAEFTGKVQVRFSDIEDYEWAKEAIEGLYRREIINGKDDTHFAPGDFVTRAEFVKMVVSALGLKLTDKDCGFSDVSADSWYAAYVATAYENNIVLGDGSKFNPEATITKEDIAVILYRAMNIKAENEKAVFTDYDTISDYAKEAVTALYEAGVVNGSGSGAFEPKKNATRAEAAKMIYLALCND